METILEYILKRNQAEMLNKRQTIEALFYTHQLIKKVSDSNKLAEYKSIESELQKRVNQFRIAKKI